MCSAICTIYQNEIDGACRSQWGLRSEYTILYGHPEGRYYLEELAAGGNGSWGNLVWGCGFDSSGSG